MAILKSQPKIDVNFKFKWRLEVDGIDSDMDNEGEIDVEEF